jgi:hypothetical protein
VKNGKYDGEWTGELRTTDTLRYNEVYAEGKMLSGTSNDGKGNVYYYTISEEKPKFKGGTKAFNQEVFREFKARELVRRGIQGVAQVKCVILTSGEISDVHVINDVDYELAAEAIRVIKLQKGWQPARIKGRVVDMPQTFPISIHFTSTQTIETRRRTSF